MCAFILQIFLLLIALDDISTCTDLADLIYQIRIFPGKPKLTERR